ncbi:MAG: altronate dehydratase family protein [Paracoccaceae bacterium]|nr:altronate dehydratase family protein [Paracoccaceae bacterium]
MDDFIFKLDDGDNVALARRALQIGEASALSCIPSGHKMAAKEIAEGEVIIKYGQPIGYAKTLINAGDHLHTHNIAYRDVERIYNFSTRIKSPSVPSIKSDFYGYKRCNGSVGTRNTIAILTSVNCSATAARMIADHFNEAKMSNFSNVDGVNAFVHGTGCGMADSGDGFEALQRVMWGYAKNPNVAGVLMVGLGCEMNQIDWLLDAYQIDKGPLFQVLNIQDVCGLKKTINKGIEKINEMLPVVDSNVRTLCPASSLVLGLQCGGSDAWSGITANPALGYACDLLVAQGGTGVLAETPEIYGAEHLLTERAITSSVGRKLLERIKWWEDYTSRNFGSMDNNPSPGNKAGGLTTILEKSLGAVSKAGTSNLNDVYKYGELITSKGFVFMDSPGYDPASVTGQIASGCNVIAFTTGRGSAFGSKPSPCIKIASNSDLFQKMPEDMDIDAGKILSENSSIEEMGKLIFDHVLAVASGDKSKSEAQGLGDFEFVPWQIGAVM